MKFVDPAEIDRILSSNRDLTEQEVLALLGRKRVPVDILKTKRRVGSVSLYSIDMLREKFSYRPPVQPVQAGNSVPLYNPALLPVPQRT